MTRMMPARRLFAALIALTLLLTLASTTAFARRHRSPARPKRANEWIQRGEPKGFRAALTRLPTASNPGAAAHRIVKRSLLDAAGLNQSQGWFFEEARALLAAGDLNGDGREDALDWWFGGYVEAIRGTDGMVLWDSGLAGFGVPIPVGNLDGVAGDDVLIAEYMTDPTTGAYTSTTRFRLISGKDGTEVWARSYDGAFTNVESGPTKGGTSLSLAVLMGTGKLNGDGVPDLLVGRYQFAFAKDPASGIRQSSGVATFEVLAGGTGQPSAAFPATGRFAAPDAIVVPDLSGDSGQDVVVASPSRNGPKAPVSTGLAAYPGGGGAALWNATVNTEKLPSLEGAELNGDDRADVLLSAGWRPTELVAVSGRTGAALWRNDSLDFVSSTFAGDANGDKGSELLVVGMPSHGAFPLGTPAAAVAKARKGKLAVPKLPGQSTSSYGCYGYGYGYGGYGGCGGGGSCPGYPGYGYGYGYGYGGGCDEQRISLIDGALGQALWTEKRTSDAWVEFPGDATGDGLQDALVVEENYDGHDWSVVSELLSGSDGGGSWSTEGDGYLLGIDADLDADGSDDLVSLTFEHDDDLLQGISGATGEPLWPGTTNLRSYLFTLDTATLGASGKDLLVGTWNRGSSALDGGDGSLLWRRW